MMTISDLQKIAHEDASAKGWNQKPITISEMISLCHSELSEALESYRNKEEVIWLDRNNNNKPEGIGAEFADVVIRIAHYSNLLGFNLEEVIKAKLEFNRTRPYRHGHKLI